MKSQIIINRYVNGQSVWGLSKDFKKHPSTILKILVAGGIELRPKKLLKQKRFFNGKAYTQNNKGYWRTTTKPRSFLQRDVFEFHAGRKVLDGHDINHIDHDKNNNDFSNLEEKEHDEHGFETRHWNKNKGSELEL